MTVVAVAGGSGDLGRLVTVAVRKTGKHDVYIVSRKNTQGKHSPSHIRLSSGQDQSPIIQTDYSEDDLTNQLSVRKVNVVISAIIMDSNSASDAQLRLIRAAERCPSVTRFMPSEYNVEYSLGDDVLPYPEKKYHMAARHELERTSTLEYTYVYPGMFMDYFGMPHVPTALRPLRFFIDPMNHQAVLPDDGESRMSMTLTTDAARFIALALDLEKWPRVMTTKVSTLTLNRLVKLVENSLGTPLQVHYQPVERLLRHEALDLPTNVEIAERYTERFPLGMSQVRALVADLEAGVALGAFDLERLSGHPLDLVKEFEGKAPPPKTIEELIEEAWKASAVRREP